MDEQLRDGADVEAGHALGCAGQVEVGEVRRERAEERTQLPAGEVGAEAEVLAVAEGDVGVRFAAHVEAVGVRELALVPVGRGVPQDDGVAGVDALPLQLDVGGCGPGELDDGDTQRRISSAAVSATAIESAARTRRLVGVFEQHLDPAGDGVAGGLVAAADEEFDDRRP